MKKSKTTPPFRAMMNPIDHERELASHERWLETGRALWAAADLIWPGAEAGFRAMDEHFAAIRHARNAGGLLAARAVALKPVGDVMEMLGYCNTYLLNAGYAVENLLK